MLIEDENGLRHAFQSITRMYNLCDQIEADAYATPSGREDELEGVRAMMRKIQRDILTFHATHPEYLALPKPQCEDYAPTKKWPDPALEAALHP